MPSFMILGLWVLEKNIFKFFIICSRGGQQWGNTKEWQITCISNNLTKYELIYFTFSNQVAEILLGFWSGNLFLIAPFPDHCTLLPLLLTGRNESHMSKDLRQTVLAGYKRHL